MENIAKNIAPTVKLILNPFLSINIPTGIAVITKIRGQTRDNNEISNAVTPYSFSISEDIGANVSHNNCEIRATKIKTDKTIHLYPENFDTLFFLIIIFFRFAKKSVSQ